MSVPAIELQQQRDAHKNRMWLGAAAMVAAAIVGCILISFTTSDIVKLGTLKNQLGNSPDLQNQYDHLTRIERLNLGFGITSYVLAILGLGYSSHHYFKKKEVEAQLKTQNMGMQEAESLDQGAMHKKKAVRGAVLAAIALIAFTVLLGVAIQCHVDINHMWDKWHQLQRDWASKSAFTELSLKIDEATATGWWCFGFSMGTLAVCLASVLYFVRHWGKRNEQNKIDAPQASASAPTLET